jgi:hypothetical protein
MVSAATFAAVKPEAVERTELILGAAAAAWRAVESRGYALGDRWIVELEDGRSAFAKRAIGDSTAENLRSEHEVYAALRACFMPQLLGWEDGRLPLLVLEDLAAAEWPPPWSRASVGAVLAALDEVAAAQHPAGLRRLSDDPPSGWDEVERDPDPFLRLGLCSVGWLDEALPVLVESAAPDLLAGDALLHFDIRSDNLCIREGRAVLVDWNLACVGNAAFDLAFWLPSLTLEHRGLGEQVERTRPEIAELAPLVAGFFAARAGLPPPPGAPAVRGFQLAQLEIALPWAVRVLGLPELS